VKDAAMGVEARIQHEHGPRGIGWLEWLPLIVLPAAAISIQTHLVPWVFMWVLAAAIFFGCKWQTWWEYRSTHTATTGRSIGYLFLWPGMDAAAFLETTKSVRRPEGREWIWAGAKIFFGVAMVWGVVPDIPAAASLPAGWIGMVGIILLLHFGSFHLVSLMWRTAGVDAQPIMQAPLAAGSLSDFWGRKWNLGFRQLTHRLIFTPARAWLGTPAAILLAFLASGVIHDLVISLPARGGYGLPTGYFLLQGLGVLLERSTTGRKLGLTSGVRGWLFAVVIAGAPAFLLFHPLFVHRVILPFLNVLGAR